MASLLEFSCSMSLAALATRLMTTKGSCWWENDWALDKKRRRYPEIPEAKKKGGGKKQKMLFCPKFFFSSVMLATTRSISNLPRALTGKCRRPVPLTKFPALRLSRNSVTADFSESLFTLPHLEGTVLLLKILFHFAPNFGFLLCSEWVLH